MNSDNALRGAADAVRAFPDSGDVGMALGKASPPIAVVGATVGGISLDDWVVALTALYLILQTAHLVWKWCRDLRRAAREDAADD